MRETARGEEELNSPKNFSPLSFSLFRGKGHADKAVRFDSDICLSRRKANKRDKFKSECRGGDPVLLLQRINFTTFILCAPFVIILQRKCYRRTLHDRVRAEIKSAIFATEFEVRLG